MSVRVIDKSAQFIVQNRKQMSVAIDRMSNDILTLAKIRVPFRSGNLQDQGKVEILGQLHHRVRFDEDYAAYQERGMRKDGSHVVRQYTTPGTGKHFLSKAGKDTVLKAVQYIRQAASRVHV